MRAQRDTPVLVCNAGSSTLKAALVVSGRERPVAASTVEWRGETDAADAFEQVVEALGVRERPILGVGHRLVHGGPTLTEPRRLDAVTLDTLRATVSLAPLHQPPALAIIDAARARLPDALQVACFDTAFHARLPEVARRYPVPEAWGRVHGIRRYGFHGLSVEWALERAATLLGRPRGRLELVVAHLGAGSSVTAVSRGRSVDTSMGYTPLEGLMMATRSGSIDPGVPIALLRDGHVTVEELEDALQHGSGLLAVGGSADMRELLARRAQGDGPATLAVAMYVDRAAAAIAAAASRLPRLDGLVFTGGIGEHAGGIRSAITRRLGVLGIPRLGARDGSDDRVLTAPGATPAVLRIAAREDLVVARAVARLARSPLPGR